MQKSEIDLHNQRHYPRAFLSHSRYEERAMVHRN
jgi:hypothetical protein